MNKNQNINPINKLISVYKLISNQSMNRLH